MSLIFLDKDLGLLSNTELFTNHNSFTGGEDIIKIHVKNVDPQYYYENIIITPVMDDLIEGDLFSDSGWSIKLHSSSEEPTEKEWGNILINSPVQIPNIGTEALANIESAYPIWIRVFCPGHTEPQIKKDMKLSLRYTKKVVLADA